MSQQKSYRDLKSRLDEILSLLEDPNIDLDEALKLHDEGLKLVTELEKYLQQVKQKISTHIKKK